MYINAEHLSDAAVDSICNFAEIHPGCAAYIEVRSQCAKGAWPHSGPDRYIALQIVPQGVEPLRALQSAAAERRGILLVYCGEGYWNRTGLRSAYGRAYDLAARLQELVATINCESEVLT